MSVKSEKRPFIENQFEKIQVNSHRQPNLEKDLLQQPLGKFEKVRSHIKPLRTNRKKRGLIDTEKKVLMTSSPVIICKNSRRCMSPTKLVVLTTFIFKIEQILDQHDDFHNVDSDCYTGNAFIIQTTYGPCVSIKIQRLLPTRF